MNITRVKFNLDLRIVSVSLLVVIILMLGFWRPWQSSLDDARSITVTGEAQIDAVADEFKFSPYFEISAGDEQEVRDRLAVLGNQLKDELIEQGVDENKIRLDASSFEHYFREPNNEEQTGQLRISISVDDEGLAQTVQDYLLRQENIKGQLTPQASFSNSKQKELRTQAREEAIADAKAQAEQGARELGVRVGQVISVEDSPSQTYPFPVEGSARTLELNEDKQGLPISPGENTLTYRIEVRFELR